MTVYHVSAAQDVYGNRRPLKVYQSMILKREHRVVRHPWIESAEKGVQSETPTRLDAERD